MRRGKLAMQIRHNTDTEERYTYLPRRLLEVN